MKMKLYNIFKTTSDVMLTRARKPLKIANLKQLFAELLQFSKKACKNVIFQNFEVVISYWVVLGI